MATVLITGANRGIGLELVKIYAARGDTVLACCRNPGAAEDLAAVAGDVEILEVSVSDADSVAAMAAKRIGVEKVVPIHFGTFPILSGTPAELRDAGGGAFEVIELELP